MKRFLISVPKKTGVYYPLQGTYRRGLRSLQRLINSIKFFRYKGKGFLCNICGRSYKKFVSDYPSSENRKAIDTNNVIAGYGENIICPNCMSTARERLVMIMLNEHFDLKGKKVLHLSPEKPIYNFLKLKCEVITADLNPGYYSYINSATRAADLMKLPFENEAFDLVIGNHILEHIPDDTRAMKEIFRVLKVGGRAILQVPYSENLASTIEEPLIDDPPRQSLLFGQKDHVRIYQFNDYVQRLRSAGFTVNILTSTELELYAIHAIQKGEHFLMIYRETWEIQAKD